MKERLSCCCVVGGSGGSVSSTIMITMQGGPRTTHHPFPSVCLRLLWYCIVSPTRITTKPSCARTHHNLQGRVHIIRLDKILWAPFPFWSQVIIKKFLKGFLDHQLISIEVSLWTKSRLLPFRID